MKTIKKIIALESNVLKRCDIRAKFVFEGRNKVYEHVNPKKTINNPVEHDPFVVLQKEGRKK